jgi:NADPH:quinone reductase-like Zn-dependent oxidoreductase
MRAIVFRQFGGPEVLTIEQVPDPVPGPDQVLIEVKAFGVNHAETHMRRGEWAEWVPISGIECVGVVRADPSGRLRPGQTVATLMGGLGRTIPGSYAELTAAAATNVVPLDTDLPWERLAAVPESYATAWACLHGNLRLEPGQTLLLRGATSALGQAALNIAAHFGAQVIATTRNPARAAGLRTAGAERVELEGPDLSARIRAHHPRGIDAALDLVGNSTLLDSLKAVRRDGRLCLAGWLGGLAPIEGFNPLLQMPSAVQFSLFGSFVFGTPGFPLTDIPLQTIVERVAAGAYAAKPAKVFRFEEIADAHRLMESNQANGKIVVTV